MPEQPSFDIDSNLSSNLMQKTWTFTELSENVQRLLGFSDEVMDAFYVAAGELYNDQKYKNALEAFLFLVSVAPQHGEYWIGLGMSLQRCEEHEEAVGAFEIAATCQLDDPVSYFHLAKCLFAMHDRDSALAAIDLALEFSAEREEYEELHHQALVAKMMIAQEI